MKPKSRKKKDAAIALGHGVWWVFRKELPLRIELRQVRALIQRLGPRGEQILHGFLVVFHASEHMASIAHSISLNGEYVKEGPLRARNGHTLTWAMYTTLHAALEAVRLLEGGGLNAIIGKDYEPWARLRRMKQRWEGDRFLDQARNVFSNAHLGKDELLAGLREVGPMETLVLEDFSVGGMRRDVTYPAVLKVLLRGLRDKNGMEYEQETFEKVAREAHADMIVYGELASLTFGETLRRVGVRLPRSAALESQILASIEERRDQIMKGRVSARQK